MSAARKMMAENVPSNRIITSFTQAYDVSATPYQKSNFHPKVKSACTENRTGCVGLKICKAVLVGDVAVGKTSLVNRFCHDVFDRDYKATIGVDFEVEKFSILSTPFTLQIWDTAGQERFKSIASSYYRGANGTFWYYVKLIYFLKDPKLTGTKSKESYCHDPGVRIVCRHPVVIVVYDLSDESSVTSISRWMEDATVSASDPIKFVVGTKKDVVSAAACQSVESRVKEIAQSLNAEYWSVSSKTGENVKSFAFRCVSLTFDAAVLREVDSSGTASQKQIGTIKMNRGDHGNLYEKSGKRKMKLECCKT